MGCALIGSMNSEFAALVSHIRCGGASGGKILAGAGALGAELGVAARAGSQAYVFDDPTTGQPLGIDTFADRACMLVFDGTENPVGLLTNSATVSFAYKYDPWGVQTLTAGGTGNGAGQNPYAFHAGIKDPSSGLMKFGQRWYNPTTGTWTQQDTLDSPLDPANANRYVFSGGDPINNPDPGGLKITNDLAGVFAGIAVGIACEGLTLGIGTVGCAVLGVCCTVR